MWERGQKDIDRTIAALERAFKIDPQDREVRAQLERIASEENRWDQICDLYLGAIDEFAPAEQAVSVHHEVARFREALGQIELAEERYLAIHALKPDDEKALERLEQIARQQSRWADLAEILERRAEGGSAPLPPGPARREKLAELARLYEEHLDKPYEAIDALERLVAEAAEDLVDDDPAVISEEIVSPNVAETAGPGSDSQDAEAPPADRLVEETVGDDEFALDGDGVGNDDGDSDNRGEIADDVDSTDSAAASAEPSGIDLDISGLRARAQREETRARGAAASDRFAGRTRPPARTGALPDQRRQRCPGATLWPGGPLGQGRRRPPARGRPGDRPGGSSHAALAHRRRPRTGAGPGGPSHRGLRGDAWRRRDGQ